MGTLKDKILILGEGVTEFYYINSLKDIFRGIAIKPDSPKHAAGLEYLAKKIEEGVSDGYRYIFCLIDMDTKETKAEKIKYEKLKQKYRREINKPKRDILCSVQFFESHLCTELFFLYYFKYTCHNYSAQPPLIRDINLYCPYEKREEFFRKCKGLHTYFEKHGGSLASAIDHANRSMIEKVADSRDYTFSEIGNLLKKLYTITNK